MPVRAAQEVADARANSAPQPQTEEQPVAVPVFSGSPSPHPPTTSVPPQLSRLTQPRPTIPLNVEVVGSSPLLSDLSACGGGQQALPSHSTFSCTAANGRRRASLQRFQGEEAMNSFAAQFTVMKNEITNATEEEKCSVEFLSAQLERLLMLGTDTVQKFEASQPKHQQRRTSTSSTASGALEGGVLGGRRVPNKSTMDETPKALPLPTFSTPTHANQMQQQTVVADDGAQSLLSANYSMNVRQMGELQRAEDEAGFMVINSYTILNELGDGMHGNVFLACEMNSGEMFAIKRVLRPQYVDTTTTASNGGDMQQGSPLFFSPSSTTEVSPAVSNTSQLYNMGTTTISFNQQQPQPSPSSSNVAPVGTGVTCTVPKTNNTILDDNPPLPLRQTLTRGSTMGLSTRHINMSAYDFRKEVAIMKKLRHPNLVRLHEVIDDPRTNEVYLVMDYVEGGSLIPGDWTAQATSAATDGNINGIDGSAGVRFSDEVVRAQFKCIAKALRYLHRHRIAHLDIKPDNILLNQEGEPVIIDFGVSHQPPSDALSPTSKRKAAKPTKFGTPCFFSPEQCKGTPADEMNLFAADVWALGVTLFAMLFRKLPFQSLSYLGLRESIINDYLVIPKQCGKEARGLLNAMLCKDPASRISIFDICNHPYVTEGSAKRPGQLVGGLLSTASTPRSTSASSPSKAAILASPMKSRFAGQVISSTTSTSMAFAPLSNASFSNFPPGGASSTVQKMTNSGAMSMPSMRPAPGHAQSPRNQPTTSMVSGGTTDLHRTSSFGNNSTTFGALSTTSFPGFQAVPVFRLLHTGESGSMASGAFLSGGATSISLTSHRLTIGPSSVLPQAIGEPPPQDATTRQIVGSEELPSQATSVQSQSAKNEIEMMLPEFSVDPETGEGHVNGTSASPSTSISRKSVNETQAGKNNNNVTPSLSRHDSMSRTPGSANLSRVNSTTTLSSTTTSSSKAAPGAGGGATKPSPQTSPAAQPLHKVPSQSQLHMVQALPVGGGGAVMLLRPLRSVSTAENATASTPMFASGPPPRSATFYFPDTDEEGSSSSKKENGGYAVEVSENEIANAINVAMVH